MLDVSLDRSGRQRCIATLLSFQNPTGGFGGGPGQISHLAATYAAVSTLGLLTSGAHDLGDGTGMEVWETVDRRAMYGWMRGLKQPDGSFVMHVGGEVDVRSVALSKFLHGKMSRDNFCILEGATALLSSLLYSIFSPRS